jgi:hypothetical protein
MDRPNRCAPSDVHTPRSATPVYDTPSEAGSGKGALSDKAGILTNRRQSVGRRRKAVPGEGFGGPSSCYFQNCHHLRSGGFGVTLGGSINSHSEQPGCFTMRILFWQLEHVFEVYHKPTSSL